MRGGKSKEKGQKRGRKEERERRKKREGKEGVGKAEKEGEMMN